MKSIRREDTANLVLRNPLVKNYVGLVEGFEELKKERKTALDRGSIFRRKEVDYCLVSALNAKLYVINKLIKMAEEDIEKHKRDLARNPTEF